ncbi:MAG: 5'/3'-nucleotidase SurE [Coriobacteriales bacterium]|jgi:5'-nucleotidase|nr:5'/3'-nucleotidase SurE [Coriobacteriales bacterium]
MKPLILIANDDGVFSPGIRAAAEAVIDFAEVLIVAPAKQQSGMGRSYPNSDDVGIIDFVELEVGGQKLTAYGVHGSPATAVSHAVLELAERQIDLCISGINYGENLGLCLTVSGTVGAALEAHSYGIPAIAVSLEASLESHFSGYHPEMDWRQCQRIIRQYAKRILAEGLPGDIALLNINIPIDAIEATPIELTTLSSQQYDYFIKPEQRDFSERYRLQYYIHIDHETLETNSDIACFAVRKHISVTPITWDLTAKTAYEV